MNDMSVVLPNCLKETVSPSHLKYGENYKNDSSSDSDMLYFAIGL